MALISGTHRMIGAAIGQHLNALFIGQVMQEEFESGCVKPDFDFTYFNVPHYKDKSLEFVLQILNKLASEPTPVKGTALKKYSTQLGVAMHFISDYFCYAHNHKKFDFIPAHLQYEVTLHFTASRMQLTQFTAPDTILLSQYTLDSVEKMREYINVMHARYLSARPAAELDIASAVSVCTTVACAVLRLSLGCSKAEPAA